ncbi:MAG: M24 family metallopeptidase [Phycisphaerales bacterium]|nr:MAG: M24 family metallopeptidase [Phycisphaerales bacterium]
MTATCPMTAPAEVYRRRRADLAARLERPVVLFAGYAPARNYETNPFPFRAGSTYLYFGGPPVEGACLVIEPSHGGDTRSALFRIPVDPDEEVWSGPATPDDVLAAAAGLDVTHIVPLEKLGRRMCDLVGIAIAPPCRRTHDLIRDLKLHQPTPDELLLVIEMRLCKDEHELKAMRRAAAVTVEAHRAAIAAAAPGRREADAAAAYAAVLEANECVHAFGPIITVNGHILHLHGHGNPMTDGNLLLIDAGAELPNGYCCDVTRVCPVNGRFTPIQRHLYDTVQRALEEATAACVPGKRYREVHDLATRVVCDGLVTAELLKGDPDELHARGAHTVFMPHGVGHLIGMEAHDMEDFGDLAGYPKGRTRSTQFGTKYLRLDRDLAAGMTVTIEPGIYLVPQIWQRDDLVGPYRDCVNRGNVDALLADRFGGIRLENTICVRSEGAPEILSEALELDAESIERLTG